MAFFRNLVRGFRPDPAAAGAQGIADRLIAEGRQAESEGRAREACDLFRAAVDAAPAYGKARLNLALGLEAIGDVEGAIARLREALANDARDPYVNYNLGRLLHARGEGSAAERLLEAAAELKADFAEAQVLLASIYESRGALAAAATSLEAALRARPDYVGARYNYGLLLLRLGRPADAESALRRVLEIDAAFAASADGPHPWHLLGVICQEQGRRDEAVTCFLKAVELRPGFAASHACLGYLYQDDDRHADAVACLQKALTLDPGSAEIRWCLTMARLPAISDSESASTQSRSAFAHDLLALDAWFDAARAAEGSKVVGRQMPFYLAYQAQANRDLLLRHGRLCARLMAAWSERERLPPPRRRRSETIRVGVVSEHFCNHAVWNAIVKGWFEQLDRAQFSLLAFSLGTVDDQETRAARAKASQFESGRRGLREWADAVLREQPDVLLYPEVGMNQTALQLASLRLAPVQAAAWGHPDTTGLPTIDYYLSAEGLEPADAQQNYTERLVPLPHLGCFYQGIPVVPAARDLSAFGIAPARPLLLCPGVPYKYAPQHDRVLVEICRRLGRCQLVFFTFRNRKLSDKLRARLQRAFADAGLQADDFLAFVPWQTSAEFHGWLSQADVFLDTIGFSGFNTAMEAVQCGLPVVTLEGRFLRGRLAGGILRRMGLQELVAQSEEDYVALAVTLAQDAERRHDLRRRMAAARHVLFEDRAPIRALEAFLRAATDRTSAATSGGRDPGGRG